MKNRGTIALDIDGTLSQKDFLIPNHLSAFLKEIKESGWQIMLVTGRIYSFAEMSVKEFHFPYYLLLQNGAEFLKMPEKKLMLKQYFGNSVLEFLSDIYKEEEGDFVVYAGYEKGDYCYYRPKHFSQSLLEYIELLKTFSKGTWQPLENYPILGQEEFPLIKCIGSRKAMERVQKKLSTLDEVRTSLIHDPISDYYTIILVTNKEAIKGQAVLKLMEKENLIRPLIAAGDDNNDQSMLEVADVKIVMETAPPNILKLADIIAPPSTQMGIIPALQEAIKKATTIE